MNDVSKSTVPRSLNDNHPHYVGMEINYSLCSVHA